MDDTYDNSNGNSIGASLLIFIAGVAVGAAAALMYAPQPGAETRARLAEKTVQFKDKMSEVGSQVAEKTVQFKDKMSEVGSQVAGKAGEIKDRIVSHARDTVEQASQAYDEAGDRAATGEPSI